VKKAPAWWFEGKLPPWWARALAGVYARAVTVRRWLYRRGFKRVKEVPVPVIVVGNLIAGGSGKTPLVIALSERLRSAGFTPGIASRGYGREDARTPRWVEADTSPRLGGDEPVLIARRTGVKVRVDADRVAAAQALVKAGCDIVICDDGLQHARLHRDLEIEVIDGQRGYGNGRLLPAGPLREPIVRAEACQFRVLNQGNGVAWVPEFPHWPMSIDHAHATPLNGGRALSLHHFHGQRIHAVAGIGHPERFFTLLRGHAIAVVPHAFPDHYHYRPEDLRFSSDLAILMTEKDAVKCAAFATDHMYCIPISARLPEAFWVTLLDRVSRLRH